MKIKLFVRNPDRTQVRYHLWGIEAIPHDYQIGVFEALVPLVIVPEKIVITQRVLDNYYGVAGVALHEQLTLHLCAYFASDRASNERMLAVAEPVYDKRLLGIEKLWFVSYPGGETVVCYPEEL